MKALTALILLLPMIASADPSPATRYLLDEPANLMDLGIIRLSTAIRINRNLISGNYEMATGISDVVLYTSADYNLASDKINIRIFCGTWFAR